MDQSNFSWDADYETSEKESNTREVVPAGVYVAAGVKVRDHYKPRKDAPTGVQDHSYIVEFKITEGPFAGKTVTEFFAHNVGNDVRMRIARSRLYEWLYAANPALKDLKEKLLTPQRPNVAAAITSLMGKPVALQVDVRGEGSSMTNQIKKIGRSSDARSMMEGKGAGGFVPPQASAPAMPKATPAAPTMGAVSAPAQSTIANGGGQPWNN